MSAAWASALNRELQLAIVADSRTPHLVPILERMLEEWGRPFNVWLSGENEDVFCWALHHELNVTKINSVPTIAVQASCLEEPMCLTAELLNPGQLVFLAQGQVSLEGILLGGLYALAALVPRDRQPWLQGEWTLLMMELYRRFSSWPVVVLIECADGTHFMSGDSWAIDEKLLAGLPTKAGSLHAAVRRLLLPPSPLAEDPGWRAADLSLPVSAATAYPCSPWQRFLYQLGEYPRRRLSAILEKIVMVIGFRLRRYWHNRRGVS